MAKIYKLYNSDLIYIGSTIKDLQVRLAQHIMCWDAHKSGLNPKRLSSYDIIDGGNYAIELLEECDVENRFTREQHYIDTIPCVNKYKAFSLYNQKDKISWATYQRLHYAANKQAHADRKKRYYERVIKKTNERKKLFRHLAFN